MLPRDSLIGRQVLEVIARLVQQHQLGEWDDGLDKRLQRGSSDFSGE